MNSFPLFFSPLLILCIKTPPSREKNGKKGGAGRERTIETGKRRAKEAYLRKLGCEELWLCGNPECDEDGEAALPVLSALPALSVDMASGSIFTKKIRLAIRLAIWEQDEVGDFLIQMGGCVGLRPLRGEGASEGDGDLMEMQRGCGDGMRQEHAGKKDDGRCSIGL